MDAMGAGIRGFEDSDAAWIGGCARKREAAGRAPLTLGARWRRGLFDLGVTRYGKSGACDAWCCP